MTPRERLLMLAVELKVAWRECGACQFYAPRVNWKAGADMTVCNGCGRSESDHLLLRWSERIEAAAKELPA